jgi:LmbE family N-acetylglucosaminyl deacetylase
MAVAASGARRDLGLSSSARVAFVVAHPDDEVIGAGGTLLQQCPKCTIVHVTDGAPADLRDATNTGFDTRGEYAAARRYEAAAALSIARISNEQIVELDVVDQHASYALADLARELAHLFRGVRPHVVFTHAYEGGHPDHDATAFAVHAARELLRPHGAAPALLEMTSYHARNGKFVPCEFLPHARRPCTTFELTSHERELKLRMFECFRTQRHVLSAFPIGVERFRKPPHYDFTKAPHDGKIYYDQFGWGMNGKQWRGLAREALASLQQGHNDAAFSSKRRLSASAGWA